MSKKNGQEKNKKKPLLERVLDSITQKRKQEQEWYSTQYSILFRATYYWYLNRILKRDSWRVDLPDFYYQMGWVIKPEALYLTRLAMAYAKQQGSRHINQSFKRLMMS